MGFANVTVDYEWTSDESKVDGAIKEILINGGLFGPGDKYTKGAEVTIRYWKIGELNDTTPDTPSIKDPDAVFYSTNNYETAKKGNTGVFSYKSKGGTYDVYWIIDFDEGYAYFFTQGNGNDTCAKIKITSGTLNDRVTITWDFDGEKIDWYLHFKYVNHPVTLIVNDHFGTAIEFTTADLSKALNIRSTKTIQDS